MADYRANYAQVSFQAHLGPDADQLEVPWATFVGDETGTRTVTIPAEAPVEPYVEMQVYEVGTYGHELLVNEDALTGFDVPPEEGWQYWMDTVGEDRLHGGPNTLQFRRADGDDGFVVGTVILHWKAPVDDT